MFQIGQEVVCIDNAFAHWIANGFNVPIKNGIYTVREIRYFNEIHYRGYAIKLKEIHNPIHNFINMKDELYFRVKYFAPLNINIEELTNILNEPVIIGKERSQYVKL